MRIRREPTKLKDVLDPSIKIKKYRREITYIIKKQKELKVQ